MTLEQIIENEKKHRIEDGQFGINACKKSISFEIDYFHKDLFELLGTYLVRAKTDVFFNKTMIHACWEMINEI